jgi:hypothetical protein
MPLIESARIRTFETHDGTFNEEALIMKSSLESIWYSRETTNEGPKQQTRGSQLTKLASMDVIQQ